MIFWLNLVNFLNYSVSFIKFLISSEISWLILFTLNLIYSAYTDNTSLTTNTLFILVFAAIEFSIGLILSFLYQNSNQTLDLSNTNNKLFSLFNKKLIYYV